jgi:cellulose biosynthesis protein BcsQ
MIVALQNQKGGVGKTALAVHIAAAFAMPSWQSSGHESGG